MSPSGNWGRGTDGTEPVDANHVVYQFERGFDSVIRASISVYRGRELLDLRQWITIDGELRPGRKGLSLPVDYLNDLESAVAALRQAIDPDGERIPRRTAAGERVA